jgi:hypothetical protein
MPGMTTVEGSLDKDTSLFAYLCERPSRPENTLTDGLGFLLRTRPWACLTIEGLFQERWGIKCRVAWNGIQNINLTMAHARIWQ